jgi:hypothetical protein
LKAIKGLTLYKFIRKRWTIEPEKFSFNPLHQAPGLNIATTAKSGGAGPQGRARENAPISAYPANGAAIP